MGTAGPLALARDILDDGSGSPFFVLNRWRGAGDVAGCVDSCARGAVPALYLKHGLETRPERDCSAHPSAAHLLSTAMHQQHSRCLSPWPHRSSCAAT